MLTIERDRIRFSHPLLASVIYGSASHERRRQLHKRLAIVVSDVEQRARHLALSTTEPDEAIAAELEQAAAASSPQRRAAGGRRAVRRGEPADADGPGRGAHAAHCSPRRRRCSRRETSRRRAVLAEEAAGTAPTQPCARRRLPDGRDPVGARELQRGDRAARSALEAAPDDRALAARVYPKLVYFNVAHRPARAVELADAGDGHARPGRRARSARLGRDLADVGRALARRGAATGAARAVAGARGASGPRCAEERASRSSTSTRSTTSMRHGRAMRSRTSGTATTARTTGAPSGRRTAPTPSSGRGSGTSQRSSSRRAAPRSRGSSSRGRGRWSSAFARSSMRHAGRTERGRETLLPLIEDAARSGVPTGRRSCSRASLSSSSRPASTGRSITRWCAWTSALQTSGVREYLPDRSEPFHVESLIALGELERREAGCGASRGSAGATSRASGST